jgi:hypothetical protein
VDGEDFQQVEGAPQGLDVRGDAGRVRVVHQMDRWFVMWIAYRIYR